MPMKIVNLIDSKHHRWHAFDNLLDWRQAACDAIFSASSVAIKQRGAFHLVITGGETPYEIYRLLNVIRDDWSAWHIYFSDERCLLQTDSRRNSYMAKKIWLDHVPIPPSQLHVIPGELGANLAADEYARTLQNVDIFDLTLLGLGEDGHTASLFPDQEWGAAPDAPDTLAVINSPKFPLQRVSLSASRLSRSRQVIFLVHGKAKHKIVAMWLAGKNIPARAIMPITGIDVLIDSFLLKPLII